MKEGVILSETNESQLKAVRKYNSQCKSVAIRYTPKELSEFERFERYISENNVNKAEYIKNLIKADLDKKGYWLPVCRNRRLTNGHIFVTNGQFRKLGMITIIGFWDGVLNSINSLSIKLFYCNTIWVSNCLKLE